MKNAMHIIVVGLLSLNGTAGWAQEPLSVLSLRQDFEARRESSSEPDLKGNGDSIPIPPGKSITLLDVDGPGVITHFWNTIAALDPFAGRSVVLRIYYDGNAKPSVQAPLGDFFGVGHGALKSFTSTPVTVSASGLSRTCYWRIPFRKHVKVTVTNESPLYPVADFYYYLDWQKHESLPEDTMYFHAEYRQSMPAAKGHYTILDTEGTGHYVGTVYSAQQVEMGWFGEGDDFIYIDGAKVPQLKGTGTEDYFNDAWGFSEFHTPFHGVSLYEGVYPGDRVTAYRWHIADPIPFKQSIRVTIEHRGRVYDEKASHPNDFELTASSERPDWVSSVGFWYQYPPSTIQSELPPASKRIAPYRVLPIQSLEHRADSPDSVHPSHVGVRYLSSGPGDAIEFDFSVDQPGRYQLSGLFQDSFLSGVFQPFLDGKVINHPIDMELGGGFKWHPLDLHDLKPGKHTLRFEQSDQESAYRRTMAPKFTDFTIEYLIVLRLEDMAGYHQLYREKGGNEEIPDEKVMAAFSKTKLELANGGQMNCYLRKGTGPTLVLVPGTWGGFWRLEGLITALPRTTEIAVVELPWQGGNRPPSLDMSMKQSADDVLKAIAAMKLKHFIVGGHSIGGMIAVEIAGRGVPGLVGAIPMEGWTHHTVVKTAFDGIVISNLTPQEEASRQADRVRGRSHLSEEELRAIGAIWGHWDGYGCLERSTIPILEIWGDRGRSRPNREALRIPDRDSIEVAWVTDASHLLILENPTEVARLVLEFLEKNN